MGDRMRKRPRSGRRAMGVVASLVAVVSLVSPAAPAAGGSSGRPAEQWEWIQHYPVSDSDDELRAVTVDAMGNAYVTGLHESGGGQKPHLTRSGYDVVVAKFGRQGQLLWRDELFTGMHEVGTGIAVDARGQVYVTGWTRGTLPGSTEAAPGAFVAKYSRSGDRLWLHQLGAGTATGIAVDRDGNAYVTGVTGGPSLFPLWAGVGNTDWFLAKYDTTGAQQWVHQYGTEWSDEATAIALDPVGNIFLTGSINNFTATPYEQNAFVAKYDHEGRNLWLRELPAAPQLGRATGVAVDPSGNAYIVGNPPATSIGSRDIYLARYDSHGQQIWLQQLGTPQSEYAAGIAVNPSGTIVVAGSTRGVFPDQVGGRLDSSYDLFLARYHRDGTPSSVVQLATVDSGDDNSVTTWGVAIDPTGSAYVVGSVYDDPLPGALSPVTNRNGGLEGFVAKHG